MRDQGPTACGSDLPFEPFFQPFISHLFRRCKDRFRYGAVRKSVLLTMATFHTAGKSGPCLTSSRNVLFTMTV